MFSETNGYHFLRYNVYNNKREISQKIKIMFICVARRARKYYFEKFIFQLLPRKKRTAAARNTQVQLTK